MKEISGFYKLWSDRGEVHLRLFGVPVKPLRHCFIFLPDSIVKSMSANSFCDVSFQHLKQRVFIITNIKTALHICVSSDRSFRLRVVSLTSRSLMSYVVPLRSETSAAHVYASFSQPWYKNVRYACRYFAVSPTDQAKAVKELTQHVRETTSEVSEQDVNETTLIRIGRITEGSLN